MTKIQAPEPKDLLATTTDPAITTIATNIARSHDSAPITRIEAGHHRNKHHKNHHQKNSGKNNSNTNQIRKHLTPLQQRQRQMDREEMQSLLAKLKQLVPGIPKHRRLSKLEIIQHVIDYIFDLQTALEQHPIASSLAASALTADLVVQHHHHQQQHHLSPSSSHCPNQTTGTITSYSMLDSCDRYFTSLITPTTTTPPTILPQRVPGSNRQPLASIVL